MQRDGTRRLSLGTLIALTLLVSSQTRAPRANATDERPRISRALPSREPSEAARGDGAVAVGSEWKAEKSRGLSPSKLFPWASFAPAIPTQEALHGFTPGARPLRHDELMRYLEALDAASPRARLVEYARSHEGRPLVYLAIGEEATIERLEAFREEHARLSDPRGWAEEGEGRAVESAKAVGWMAYGIHGDELSSTDAAAALAYWLVAGEDARAATLRRELVILIDPCENPDGRERFLAQTRSFAHARPSPDIEDLSHTTVWPWGRGNHYLFDLNRDWFTLVQPESRRSSVIASWSPQLMVDSHEMGADDTYLFSPPRHPFNPFLPSTDAKWAGRYAAEQSRALDARGYAYYTGEWNEEFFPGYGSSWAAYLGAVGILYEMSSTEGTLVRQPAGTRRTYAEAVEHHVTSSVANLETLAANRGEAMRDFLAARREAIRRGAEGPVRAWILPPGRHPERTDALALLLRAQGIEVLGAAAPTRAAGLRDARTGESASRDLPAGTWMVPMDQPSSPLARVVLDPHVPMESGFLREEREYLERGKGTRLYDTTSWSLPLAYGVDAYWTATRPAGDWRDDAAPLAESKRAGLLQPLEGTVFGYLFEGTSDGSVFALADLLQRGVAVRVAEKPFRVAGRAYEPGAVLVKREGNPDDLASQLTDVAARWRIQVRATATAKADEGPDLGGGHFHPLVAPRVGVWTGMPVSAADYGALWHLFDKVADLRFTGLDIARFDSADLARYNVLIFPPVWGSAEAYKNLLGKDGLDRLKRWIEGGGTAIGIGAGAEFLADKDVALTKARLRRQALDRFPPPVWGVSAEEAQSAGPLRAVGLAAPPAAAGQEESAKDRTRGARREASDRTESGASRGAGDRAVAGGRGAEAEGGSRTAARTGAQRSSPYDVAPVLGPGAKPFAQGFDQGTSVGGRPVDLATWLKPFLPPGQDKPKDEDLQRADERLRRFAPAGAFLRVELDPDVWLDWGLSADLPVWVRASDALVAEPPVQVAARFSDLDRLHLAGLLWPEAAARIARTAYATREGVGRGQVILFLDHPVHRGWMLGTRRLFLNAVLYGPGKGTRWSTPW